MPQVSIIIPYYNHGAFLQETLDSIEQLSYKDYEVIIVNDGSSDHESIALIEKLKNNNNFKIIEQEHQGPSIARNNALKIANGKYIAFLDADDLIRKDTLEICIKNLEENKKIAVVYGDCMWFGEKQGIKKQGDFNIVIQLRANDIAICSVIRKEALEDVGGFDEYLSMKGLEDWDLWFALYEKGWNFCYVEKTFFSIRVAMASRTFTVANTKIEELTSYIYKKHSDLLASQYLKLYHANKNFRKSPDFRIGQFLLSPVRILNKLFRKK